MSKTVITINTIKDNIDDFVKSIIKFDNNAKIFIGLEYYNANNAIEKNRNR